jgi:FkbM family methyltransferase
MRDLASDFVQKALQSLPFKNDRIAQIWGKLTRGKARAVVNSARMVLDLREAIQRTMFLGGYEPEQTLWFRRCLRPGDIAVDVGASFGYYTTLSSTLVGSMGRVYAFEPSPIASRVIEKTIAESQIGNVVLTRAALGREASTVSLFLPSTPNVHSPSILPSDESFEPVQVPVFRLDEFKPLANHESIRLLKMDVEGYEPNVLDGMVELIGDGRIENIICEFNSGWLRRNSTTPAALLEKFLSFGFVIREKTILQANLLEPYGDHFDLQDIWFTKPSSLG